MSIFKTIKMKYEDGQKWLTALRSGKYKQGRGALQDIHGGYCCLGVLQHCLTGEVETTETGAPMGLPTDGWLRKRGITFFSAERDFSGEITRLKTDRCVDPALGRSAASNLNDIDKLPFTAIADIVEQYIEYTDKVLA